MLLLNVFWRILKNVQFRNLVTLTVLYGNVLYVQKKPPVTDDQNVDAYLTFRFPFKPLKFPSHEPN